MSSLVVWDIQEDKEVIRFAYDSENVYDVDFSPNGKQIAIAAGQTVAIVDLLQGTEVAKLNKGPAVLNVAFSRNGQEILLYSSESNLGKGFVTVWNSQSGEQITQLPYELAYTAAVSPDGKRTVTGGTDRSLRVWDNQSEQEISRVDLNYLEDGNFPEEVGFIAGAQSTWAITSGDEPSKIGSWDVVNGEEIMVSDYSGIGRVSADGRRAATQQYKKSVFDGSFMRVWDTEKSEEIVWFKEDEDCRFSADFSFNTDGEFIAVPCYEGSISADNDRLVILDVQNRTSILLPTSIDPSDGFSLGPNGQQIAVRYRNEDDTITVEVWKIEP